MGSSVTCFCLGYAIVSFDRGSKSTAYSNIRLTITGGIAKDVEHGLQLEVLRYCLDGSLTDRTLNNLLEVGLSRVSNVLRRLLKGECLDLKSTEVG